MANVVIGMMQAEVDRWSGIESVLVDYATAVSHGGIVPEKETHDDEAAPMLLGEGIELPEPADETGGDDEEKTVPLGDLAVRRAIAKLDGSVEQMLAMIASAKEVRDSMVTKVDEELQLEGEKNDAMKEWEREMGAAFESEQGILEARVARLCAYGKAMIGTFVAATRTMYEKLDVAEKTRTENEGAVLEALRRMVVAAIGGSWDLEGVETEKWRERGREGRMRRTYGRTLGRSNFSSLTNSTSRPYQMPRSRSSSSQTLCR